MRIELQKEKMIGQGATAEVYTIGSDKVLKLYRKMMPRSAVEYEYRAAKAAESCEIRIAKALEFVEQDGRCGIIFERVFGPSMLKAFLKPWNLRKNAVLFATLQYKMHQAVPKDLLPYKAHLASQIEKIKQLDEREKKEVLKLLDGLPDGMSLCHGDYHPDNIILTADEPVIIDWMTAGAGCPAADVSRSCLILTYTQLPGNIPLPIKAIINRYSKSFCKIYIKEYLKLSGFTAEQIDAWRIPLAAARLFEYRPPYEQEQFLSIVREYTDRLA